MQEKSVSGTIKNSTHYHQMHFNKDVHTHAHLHASLMVSGLHEKNCQQSLQSRSEETSLPKRFKNSEGIGINLVKQAPIIKEILQEDVTSTKHTHRRTHKELRFTQAWTW